MSDLANKLKLHAEYYKQPPYGREVNGTKELLLESADRILELETSVTNLKHRFLDGVNVHYQGDDESDGIECPICRCEVARNDDYPEMKPKHCPSCGTKLIY